MVAHSERGARDRREDAPEHSGNEPHGEVLNRSESTSLREELSAIPPGDELRASSQGAPVRASASPFLRFTRWRCRPVGSRKSGARPSPMPRPIERGKLVRTKRRANPERSKGHGQRRSGGWSSLECGADPTWGVAIELVHSLFGVRGRFLGEGLPRPIRTPTILT